MIYVVILVVVGAAGIFKLWTAQRATRARLYSIDAHDGLKRLSTRRMPGTIMPGRSDELGSPRQGRPAADLSPENRAAAKRRIETRRRATGMIIGERGRNKRTRAS